MVTTGDDAVELAYRLRGRDPGDGVGLALRRARYADVADTDAVRVARVVRAVADRRGVPVVRVPISAVPHERDDRAIEAALGGTLTSANTAPGWPRAPIDQVSRCRVLVAGSYHAAVFALAQGIPAIGLAGSAYYVEKFRGLADQFDGHCAVVRLGGSDVADRLERALNTAWDSADELRGPLLEAAERQVEAGQRAYARLADVVPASGKPEDVVPWRQRVAGARHRLAVAVRPRLPFNCGDQEDPSWDERADEAVRLLARDLDGASAPAGVDVADLGCGNQRLRGALEAGLRRSVRYRGYDLHPQSPEVARLDVERGLPSGPFDAVFCLGLLEYLSDVDAFARGLRQIAARVVVSYVVADGSERLTPAEREARGWRSHLTRTELEQRFRRAGFEPDGAVVTNRGRTIVWLWRAPETS
jgi:hypothetical protein